MAAAVHLDIIGAFHPTPHDTGLENVGTLLLLGPKEPGFWDNVSKSAEFSDGQPDPIDRWSSREISSLATAWNGTALFPFGEPPYRPFLTWATQSGRSWVSPAHLLVHDQAGLMVSYRGAVALAETLDIPKTGTSPCPTCADRPCLSACPVGAISEAGYDLSACHEYLDTPEGADCMENGCAVRRSCPVSKSYNRNPVQSAHHMKAFHR